MAHTNGGSKLDLWRLMMMIRFNDASTHEGHLRQNGEHGSVMKRL